MKSQFKVRQKLRIKSTKTAKKILSKVWLPWAVCGSVVTLEEKNDRVFGTPPIKCHRVSCEKRRDAFWVPEAALEAL